MQWRRVPRHTADGWQLPHCSADGSFGMLLQSPVVLGSYVEKQFAQNSPLADSSGCTGSDSHRSSIPSSWLYRSSCSFFPAHPWALCLLCKPVSSTATGRAHGSNYSTHSYEYVLLVRKSSLRPEQCNINFPGVGGRRDWEGKKGNFDQDVE